MYSLFVNASVKRLAGKTTPIISFVLKSVSFPLSLIKTRSKSYVMVSFFTFLTC